jgi:hypothetical protein
VTTKLKARPLQVPLRLATDSPEAPPELLTDLRMDTPTGERSLVLLRPCLAPSRPLNPRHIVDLARSICAFGLIEPLAIDVEDTVVAGSHRLAALQILATPPPERGALLARLCPHGSAKELLALAGEPVQGLMPAPGVLDLTRIPCRILPWSSSAKPDEAWRVQVAENERRRDYKPSEVRALAERLRAQGYRFGKGAPKEGERLAGPVLSALIGVSARHVRRLLAAEDGAVIDPADGRTDVRKEASAIAGRLRKIKLRAAAELSDGEHRAIEKAVAALEKLARG